MQVVLCTTASSSPVPLFNLGNVFRGPVEHLARVQERVEQHTEDSYRVPGAGYGVPEASYGAPESQCVCQQELNQKEEKKKKGGVFGLFDAIGNLFKPKKIEPENSYGVPQDTYGVPQDSYAVPDDSHGIPEAGYGAPVANPCVCPTAEYGAPLEAPQATSYEAPEPVYAAPVPVYHSPEPAYEAPEPTYSAPVYETTQKPIYVAPEASYESPENSYEGPVATITLPIDSPPCPSSASCLKGAIC